MFIMPQNFLRDEEIRELVKQFQKSSDEAERGHLFQQVWKNVKGIAILRGNTVRKTLGIFSRFPYEQMDFHLQSIARRAMGGFDFRPEVKFSSYAFNQNRVRDSIGREVFGPRWANAQYHFSQGVKLQRQAGEREKKAAKTAGFSGLIFTLKSLDLLEKAERQKRISEMMRREEVPGEQVERGFEWSDEHRIPVQIVQPEKALATGLKDEETSKLILRIVAVKFIRKTRDSVLQTLKLLAEGKNQSEIAGKQNLTPQAISLRVLKIKGELERITAAHKKAEAMGQPAKPGKPLESHMEKVIEQLKQKGKRTAHRYVPFIVYANRRQPVKHKAKAQNIFPENVFIYRNHIKRIWPTVKTPDNPYEVASKEAYLFSLGLKPEEITAAHEQGALKGATLPLLMEHFPPHFESAARFRLARQEHQRLLAGKA